MIVPSAAFCDWLDVTYSPDNCPLTELQLFFSQAGLEVDDFTSGVGFWSPERSGLLKMGVTRGVFRVSCSGGFVGYLRSAGLWLDFLSILGSLPHRITRLDLAVDTSEDGADVLDRLRTMYASGSVRLTRKLMPTKLFLSVRPDGRESGTFYVGHRSRARVTARVYDKALERFERAGILTVPKTRYEVTLRQDTGVTLRDACECDRAFYHFASPALIDSPDDVPDWSADWGRDWSAGPRPELLAAEVLERRIAASAELSMLASVADSEIGPEGRIWLARRILERLGVSSPALSRSSALALE